MIEITDRPSIQRRFWIVESTFTDENGEYKGILDMATRELTFVRIKDAEDICNMLNSFYDSATSHCNDHGREFGARVKE